MPFKLNGALDCFSDYFLKYVFAVLNVYGNQAGRWFQFVGALGVVLRIVSGAGTKSI